jgi:DNA-binding LytR/AlgR family response regulator
VAQRDRYAGGSAVKILLVDDETVAARRLERLTRRILGEAVERLTVAHELDRARALLQEETFDLILLDLNLAGEDGFGLLAERICGASVIVVSAHPHRAIEAFQHAVLDFVPKPVGEDRLRQALERARDAAAPSAPRRLVVRSHGRVDIVDIDAIVRISGADDYCEILLSSGRTLLCDRLLTDLESELPQSMFLRVHRSHVVNLHLVEAVDLRSARPALRHRGGAHCPVSRRRLSELKDRLRLIESSRGDL